MTAVTQPSGSVTLVFTDIEGSTKLLHELGTQRYKDALAEHRRIVREACGRYSGYEVDYEGDAFFYAFDSAKDAVSAVSEAMEGLEAGPISIRVGIHTGEPELDPPKYVGMDVHKAARIMSSAHGGQVVCSPSTRALLPPEIDLIDLGEHRFKDLSAPERVYQLGAGSFPPLKTLHQTNLPVPQTPFLGREKELGEVMELVARPDVRLLTLTGPGGTGKTRLAAQAAGALADQYPDGVFWVPLAPIRDSELVLDAAAKAVGSANGLVSHVRDKKLLLLLDNFEQVVDAAPEISTLLGECPRVEVLVTSRELLHLSGEHEYPVPPLAHEEGVGFFAARARTIRPDFEIDDTVSEICRRLDDLPLALELAAARLKALSPSQILERLDERLPLLTGGARDLPERQRTLRAAIEWSYELLPPAEQQLFARLSVFAGGCTLEAAEAVCDADLDALQSLVEKSLLRFTDERYWMLETIREYALERLNDSQESDEFYRRHATWYERLADRSYPEWRGPPGVEWLRRFNFEIDNLRTAVEWALGKDKALALSLVASPWLYWVHSGRAAEGRGLLQAAWTADAPPALRLRALQTRSAIAMEQDDYGALEESSKERLRLARAMGDRFHEAASALMLGGTARLRADLPTSRTYYEESIAIWRELDDKRGLSAALGNLAQVERDEGNLARARSLLEEDLAMSKAEGSGIDVLWAVKELAMTAIAAGEIESARAYLIEGFDLAARVASRLLEQDLVFAAATLAGRLEEDRMAALLAGAVAGMAENSGGNYEGSNLEWIALSTQVRERIGDTDFDECVAHGRALEHEAAVQTAHAWLAESLTGLRSGPTG